MEDVIFNGFALVWVLMYRYSKSTVIHMTTNFELEYMNISSKHSNSNFDHHIVIH